MPRHPQVHFRLKPKDPDGKCSIYLQFLYKKNRLFFGFGQRVSQGDWSNSKQRVKKNNATTEDGKFLLNDLLDNLEKECWLAYNTEIKDGIPAPGTIRKHLMAFLNQNADNPQSPSLIKLIDRFINDEIKHNGRNKSPNTIKTYRTIKGHLIEFQHIFNYPVDFDSITLEFHRKYVDFLMNREMHTLKIEALRPEHLKNRLIKNLGANSVSKDIQLLKVFMSEAVDLGYTNNIQFRHKKFAVSRQDTDAVYLTSKEIEQLYRHDLSKNLKLERARDLFVFGCLTGLRFSDYSRVKPENVVSKDRGYRIKIYTQKTGDLVHIPCDHIVLKILEKYNYDMQNLSDLPRSYKDYTGKFNPLVKETCKLAGLTVKGRLADDPNLELWQCVGSHTARRSFATNYYLDEFPTIELMRITGHKTEKSFMRYIKISKEGGADRLQEHMNKKLSATVLRVAN